jgi:hypothetical protein
LHPARQVLRSPSLPHLSSGEQRSDLTVTLQLSRRCSFWDDSSWPSRVKSDEEAAQRVPEGSKPRSKPRQAVRRPVAIRAGCCLAEGAVAGALPSAGRVGPPTYGLGQARRGRPGKRAEGRLRRPVRHGPSPGRLGEPCRPCLWSGPTRAVQRRGEQRRLACETASRRELSLEVRRWSDRVVCARVEGLGCARARRREVARGRRSEEDHECRADEADKSEVNLRLRGQ